MKLKAVKKIHKILRAALFARKQLFFSARLLTIKENNKKKEGE